MNISDAVLRRVHLVRIGLYRKRHRNFLPIYGRLHQGLENNPEVGERELGNALQSNGMGREKMERNLLERKQASTGSNNPGLFMALDYLTLTEYPDMLF